MTEYSDVERIGELLVRIETLEKALREIAGSIYEWDALEKIEAIARAALKEGGNG